MYLSLPSFLHGLTCSPSSSWPVSWRGLLCLTLSHTMEVHPVLLRHCLCSCFQAFLREVAVGEHMRATPLRVVLTELVPDSHFSWPYCGTLKLRMRGFWGQLLRLPFSWTLTVVPSRWFLVRYSYISLCSAWSLETPSWFWMQKYPFSLPSHPLCCGRSSVRSQCEALFLETSLSLPAVCRAESNLFDVTLPHSLALQISYQTPCGLPHSLNVPHNLSWPVLPVFPPNGF